MKLYKIRDWSELFENNRTRDMKAMAWIPVPNKHDGYGYTTVVGRKNGAAIYGAWMVILQVASKCEPRGTLLRSPQQPHDAASISRMTRIPEPDIQNALDICSEETQWLEVTEVAQIPHLPAEIPHPPAERPPPSPQATDEERRKGMEGKGTEQNGTEKNRTASGGVVIPQGLSTPQFLKEWDKWVDARKAMGKKPKDWAPMFQEQIDWLNSFGAKTAIEMVSASIRNNWQGIFEIRNGKPAPSKPEPKQIEEHVPVKLL